MKSQTSSQLSFALMSALAGFPQISETIYTPSLPSIAESLSTSAHLVEWTLSVYFIGFAIGVGSWGILADKIGRRPVMLIGIILYCLATFACWQANSIGMLMCFRVIQAFGASVGSVITQTMLRDVLTGNTLKRWFSLIGIPLALAPALGPLCGGWLDYLFGWRANFMALLGMGLCLVLICYQKLPETKPVHLAPSTVRLLPLAWQLCCDNKVLGCAVLVAIINGLLFSFYAEAPFILMENMGLTANQYGWVGLAIALASVIGSVVSHRLHHYFAQEVIIGIGCILMLMGSLGLVIVAHMDLLNASNPCLGTAWLLTMMFIITLGSCGLAIPNLLSMALTSYRNVLGKAGSLFGMLYYVLAAFMIAIMGQLHNETVFAMPWYFLVLSLMMIGVFYHLLLSPYLKSRKLIQA